MYKSHCRSVIALEDVCVTKSESRQIRFIYELAFASPIFLKVLDI